MKTVRNLLKEKGARVWSASPKTPVFEALQLMANVSIQFMERAARGESDLLTRVDA